MAKTNPGRRRGKRTSRRKGARYAPTYGGHDIGKGVPYRLARRYSRKHVHSRAAGLRRMNPKRRKARSSKGRRKMSPGRRASSRLRSVWKGRTRRGGRYEAYGAVVRTTKSGSPRRGRRKHVKGKGHAWTGRKGTVALYSRKTGKLWGTNPRRRGRKSRRGKVVVNAIAIRDKEDRRRSRHGGTWYGSGRARRHASRRGRR